MSQSNGERQRRLEHCVLCGKITYQTIVLGHELQYYVKDKTKKKIRIQEFYQAVNALLNEKGGGVIVHVDDPNHLGLFDQKIDDKLQQLVPDHTLFHANFERFFHFSCEKYHVIFRVKPRDGAERLSTLDFNTKVSVNQGLVNPTQAQMKLLVECIAKPETSDSEEGQSPSYRFKQEEQVVVQGKSSEEPFQESTTVQAKCAPAMQANTDVIELLKYCWDKLKIKEYVSAFAKIPEGGSVYVGVKEKESEEKKWVEVQESEVTGILTVQNIDYTTWKDDGGESTPADVYYVAKQNYAVPCKKQAQTGGFVCAGICLTPQQRKQFKEKFLCKVCEEMMWLGTSAPEDPVSVLFHDVEQGGPDMCVIEVRVNYFHGIVFYESCGPVSFTCKTVSNQAGASCSALQQQFKSEKLELNIWKKRIGCANLDKVTPKKSRVS